MYSFSMTFEGGYTQAIQCVTQELAKEGFGILTEIDVKATLKKKLGIDRKPYIILGACNPALANQALDAEPDIGILLPCNVVVREEEDGSISIVFMNPESVLELVGREEVQALAQDVRGRLERVRDALGGNAAG